MESGQQVREPGLLVRARQEGKPDVFAGKRSWRRYVLGLTVELSTNPADESASWDAAMHNVSGGGMGVWSKSRLPAGSEVYIRDGGSAGQPAWLAGRVTHCTLGLRGHLIGIRFDEPAEPDVDSPAQGPEVTEEPCGLPRPRSGTPLFQSLRAKATVGSALACASAAVIAWVLYRQLVGHIGTWQAAAVGIGVALALGTISGWVIVNSALRSLNRLQTALRELATGQPFSLPPGEACCSEVAALSRAVHDLGAQWRKREHDERAHREKLEEITRIKTNILSVVSHDLRTPLTSVLLYAQILSEELETLAKEDARNFVGIIREECTRLSRLVDDLLEVQRLESDQVHFELTPCDLAGTIGACVRVFEPLAVSKSMTFSLDCPPSLPPVSADPDKIAQVLSNLISNALKYAPAKGTVRVSAEVRGREVLVCVADSGPGIPREKWDQIFDRFTQLCDPNVCEIAGFGLGLNILKRIVELHGGITWVDSEVGRGSAFYVSLPTEGSRTTEPSKRGLSAPAGRVLVCDADPELAATIAQTLEDENYDVRLAHSGQRLVQRLEHGEFDVLITDVLLPDMDADEVLDVLNRMPNRFFRTIIHSYTGQDRELRRRGVDVFLKRPVSRDDLVEAVRAALGKRTAAGLIAVLVESPYLRTDRLRDVLVEAGHTVVVAESMEEAVKLVRRHGADVLLTSTWSIPPSWYGRKEAGLGAAGEAHLVVLCDSVQQNEWRLRQEHGAAVVTYRPGQEEKIVDVLMAFESESAEECNV